MIKKMKGLSGLILLIDSPSFPRRRTTAALQGQVRRRQSPSKKKGRDSRLRGNDKKIIKLIL